MIFFILIVLSKIAYIYSIKTDFMNFKKLLSYFVPINIYHEKSVVNKSLEVTWNNGKLVLDTENTNYSYGSLEKVLRFGLQQIDYKIIKPLDSILILGVAGGSVIKILVDEIQFKGKITGVEIDVEIIELANKYFGLNTIKNLEIIIEDAQSFVEKTSSKYDLIIVDIFQDKVMPDFLFEQKFASNLQKIMNKNGLVLFNTIAETMKEETRNDIYIERMLTKNIIVERFPNIEGKNELLILKNNL